MERTPSPRNFAISPQARQRPKLAQDGTASNVAMTYIVRNHRRPLPSPVRASLRTTWIVFSTVAGLSRYCGDGCAAADASLDCPSGVAVDSSGNLFIADTGNNVVREVNCSTGLITTVAGNGVCGFSGDGCAATSAELDAPTGVAVDAAGDLFIADCGNNVVREVIHATGLITTVAGNGVGGYSGDGYAAASAEFNVPSAVAVDTAGDLFIADSGNNVIREVNLSTGLITTTAGNGISGYSGDGYAAAARVELPNRRRGRRRRGPPHRGSRQQRRPRSHVLHGPDRHRRRNRDLRL